MKFLPLTLACAALICANIPGAIAREKIVNHPTVYKTGPSDLPAEVPDSERKNRDHDWLGGYLNGNDCGNGNSSSGNATNCSDSNSQQRRRKDWRERHLRHRN